MRDVDMVTMDEIERLMFAGGDVVGDDGKKIGGIGEVFLDATTGRPAWVTVKTGLFGTSESFVPLDAAVVRGDEVHVPFGKDTVKHAPRIETAGGQLSPQEERELYRYYGLVDDDPVPDAEPREDHHHLADADAGTGHGRHVREDVPPETPVVVSTGAHRADQDHLDADADARPDDPDDDVRRQALLDEDRRDDRPAPPTADPTPVPDDGSMVRSEERVRVLGTERVPTERVRMRRYTVTETRQVTVPVTREELRLEYEPDEPGAAGEIIDSDTRGTHRGDPEVEPDGSTHDTGSSRP